MVLVVVPEPYQPGDGCRERTRDWYTGCWQFVREVANCVAEVYDNIWGHANNSTEADGLGAVRVYQNSTGYDIEQVMAQFVTATIVKSTDAVEPDVDCY